MSSRQEEVQASFKTFQEEIDEYNEVGRAARYERAYGSGLEEFIEAVSFMHFLEHTSLITLTQVQALFVQGDKEILFIPASRYLLGLSDLTGELMRFATNAVGLGEANEVVLVVLNLIRDIRSNLDPFVPLIRDMKKKQTVTTQSMRKIEDVSYAIKVRSSEYGSNPAALQEMLLRSLASSSRQDREGMEEEE
jgi:predicted translin family RNA/ssDNA-binding protein